MQRHKCLPGITGWAQINGRDSLNNKQKVMFEIIYLQNHSFCFDLKIIFLTVLVILKKNNILH